jgi:hypothetical protein
MVSLTGIMILLKINNNIAAIYAVSGEKTRALFSVVEFGFIYKYFFAAFGIIAVLLTIQAYRMQENKKWLITASFFSSFALFATFIKLWKFMVWMH